MKWVKVLAFLYVLQALCGIACGVSYAVFWY